MFPWQISTDPAWRELERFQMGMDRLFNLVTAAGRPLKDPLWRGAQLFPLLNVKELDHSFVITAEIPGMKTEDLEIKIESDTLTLKGERRPVEDGDKVSYHRRERATGIFQRSLTLSSKVDTETVDATYTDGILTVTLHKERAAQPRQIPVKFE